MGGGAPSSALRRKEKGAGRSHRAPPSRSRTKQKAKEVGDLVRPQRTPQRLDGSVPLASRQEGRNRLHHPHQSEELALIPSIGNEQGGSRWEGSS
jgi:hypothetical protein